MATTTQEHEYLDSSFDSEDAFEINWDMYRRVQYKNMQKSGIDRFSPDDFYMDDAGIIRNKTFSTGPSASHSHYILGTLDLGDRCVWVFNDALSSIARERFCEYMEGIWVPKDVFLLPKYGVLIGKHVGWNRFRERLFGPGATCNGWKNWRDAPGYKELGEPQ